MILHNNFIIGVITRNSDSLNPKKKDQQKKNNLQNASVNRYLW